MNKSEIENPKSEIQIEQIRPELTWRLRQRILYPAQKMQEMAMDEDNNGIHFAAFKDNVMVGVVSLFQKSDDFQFRKFAIDESVQGMGIGRQMLDYITDFAVVNGGKRIWCNARVTAIGFYLKAGFKHTGQLFSKSGFEYEILEKGI
ncbi:GNAT family N-acetyltransferase [Mucilaginibacter sp. FT3.2]|uniref:GNAT family N-acetyltransferase n=1 Tax=Mucilaginibacter sp. FT3.2 TaxID=2723090 RepID=UPI00160A7CD6|nr:GNAT family N-acetyltransferase [Mucilaginibacter sp. FT3.2]MBB6231787.1 phosphoribosylformimino-5-aminoimidazole carboxamide ribotide isomerase [Mucilaginibacter sp. FT3.2]